MINAGDNNTPQTGVYFGEVVDVYDPDKRGRIKVRTPHYVTAPDSMIPWAEYCAPGNGGSADTGFYFIPNIGSQVIVAFVGGSVEHPVWMGATPGFQGSQSDTHVAHMNSQSPYGNYVENWEETLVNTITTIGGHRIVLDDNYPTTSAAQGVNVRRIVMESSVGHFMRVIEDQDQLPLAEGQERPALELGTVRPDNPEIGYIRRLRLDHKAENITLTGPDAVDDGQHEIEINSADDYISATTSRQYKLILDDANELIDLYTTRPGAEIGNQMVFNNPNQTIDIKSYQDTSGMSILDNGGGYIDMYMPHGVPHESRNADIGIKHADGAYMVAGSGMSQNGFKADWSGNRVVMWSGAPGGAADGGTLQGGIARVEVFGPLAKVYAGNESHHLDTAPGLTKLYNSNQTEVYGAATAEISSGANVVLDAPLISISGILAYSGGGASVNSDSGGGLSLECSSMQMIQTAGSTIAHDYFLHVHEVDFGNPNGGVPATGSTSTATTPSGGPVSGVVRTSYPTA